MPRPPRITWALFCLICVGCSALTDFDRDKLGTSVDHNQTRDGGGSGQEDGMDAALGPQNDTGVTHIDPDTGLPSGEAAVMVEEDAGPPQQCKSHAECPSSRLCCGGTCVATNAEARCTDCEAACVATSANACNERLCGCGAKGPCSGDKKYCTGSGRDAVCAQCRDASDCEGGLQCIQGKCAACDPANNAGCMGTTPICNGTTYTCEACKDAPDNCPGNPVCTASGACGGCTADDAADCTSPTAPICNLAVNPSMCRACMSDTECMTELSRPYCVGNQRCAICNPANDMGCNATSGTPDCRLNTNGVYQCQACNSTSCAAGQRCDTTSGKCVQCRNDNDCDSNSATPYCDTAMGVCRGCTAVGGSNAANTWCGLNTLLSLAQRPVCHTSGRCVRCDANNAGICTAPQRCYVPDANAPQNNVCAACRPGVAGDCSGTTPVCNASTRMCRGCGTDAECPGAACDGPTGRCVPCTMATGCSGANGSCLLAPGNSAMNRCVDCTGMVTGECSGNTPVCDVNRQTCVPCLAPNTGCGNQVCIAGATTSQNRCAACSTPDDCKGGNACQTPTCSANVCSYPAKSTDDGFSCTEDMCSSNGTIVHNPIHSRCTNMCVTAMCLGAGGAAGTGCGPATQTVVCEGSTCNPNTGCPAPSPAPPATTL